MFRPNRQMYKYIGSGSSRKVFDLGNGYVVKIAKNKAGIAQNKAEYKISLLDSSNLFAKVMKSSNDFHVLIMEKADKVENLAFVCNYFNVDNILQVVTLEDFQNLYHKYNLLLNDLCRISSWGIINGKPVIIDYGFTKEIRDRFYSYH